MNFCASSSDTVIVPNSIGPLSYIEKRSFQTNFNYFNITSDPLQQFGYTFNGKYTALPSWIVMNSTSLSIDGFGSQVGVFTVTVSVTPTPCGVAVSNDIEINIIKNNPPTFGSSGTYKFTDQTLRIN